MNICGIICEYNPLHEGHLYQLEQAKQLIKPDFTVALMSGSFVQRGSIAVFDKFARANAALESGFDACLELPQAFSVQSAEYFALGSILALDELGCTHVCFGSELETLEEIRAAVAEEKNLHEKMKAGLSYGQSLSCFEGQPNAMLGRLYMTAIEKIGSDLIPVAVKRDEHYASATSLREKLLTGEMPAEMFPFDSVPLNFEKYFPIIKYKLMGMTEEELAGICGVGEGLEYKIKKEVYGAKSLDDLIQRSKSKRYPYTRISRILCCVLLDLTKAKLRTLLENVPKCRLLGIRKEKTELLSLLSNYYISPVDAARQDESTALSSAINVRGTQLYSLYSDLTGEEDFTKGLIKV